MPFFTFHTAPSDCYDHGIQAIGEPAADPVQVDSADICHLVCLAKVPECNFFSFNTADNTCSLLASVTEHQESFDSVSGVKVCTSDETTLAPEPLTTILRKCFKLLDCFEELESCI